MIAFALSGDSLRRFKLVSEHCPDHTPMNQHRTIIAIQSKKINHIIQPAMEKTLHSAIH